MAMDDSDVGAFKGWKTTGHKKVDPTQLTDVVRTGARLLDSQDNASNEDQNRHVSKTHAYRQRLLQKYKPKSIGELMMAQNDIELDENQKVLSTTIVVGKPPCTNMNILVYDEKEYIKPASKWVFPFSNGDVLTSYSFQDDFNQERCALCYERQNAPSSIVFDKDEFLTLNGLRFNAHMSLDLVSKCLLTLSLIDEALIPDEEEVVIGLKTAHKLTYFINCEDILLKNPIPVQSQYNGLKYVFCREM